MRDLVRKYKKNPSIRELAAKIVQPVPGKNSYGEITAIYNWVLHNIRYTPDITGVETLHTPDVILELQHGDCDDLSLLTNTLLESIGKATAFKAIGFKLGEFTHVYSLVKLGSKWVPIDCTMSRGIGWEPPGIVSQMTVMNRG